LQLTSYLLKNETFQSTFSITCNLDNLRDCIKLLYERDQAVYDLIQKIVMECRQPRQSIDYFRHDVSQAFEQIVQVLAKQPEILLKELKATEERADEGSKNPFGQT
jgi:hypothetical protein